MKKLLFILLLLCLSSNAFAQNKGVLLENLTWQEAEKALKPETVVVIPLGAAAKEHGPHLKLKNDWTMAEYYKRRVLKAADVVIAPTVNYHFFPSFLEYPGSTSLRLESIRRPDRGETRRWPRARKEGSRRRPPLQQYSNR